MTIAGHQLSRHLFRAEGIVVVLITCGYLGLTFLAIWKWNPEISGALITGFALFANKMLDKFSDMVKNQIDVDAGVTTTSTVVANPPAAPAKPEEKLP